MSYLDIAKKVKEDFRKGRSDQCEIVSDPTQGRIVAVKICSDVLDSCTWLSFDDSFRGDDDETLAVFYADEIPLLRNKTAEQLREIHQWKLTFGPGTNVRQSVVARQLTDSAMQDGRDNAALIGCESDLNIHTGINVPDWLRERGRN